MTQGIEKQSKSCTEIISVYWYALTTRKFASTSASAINKYCRQGRGSNLLQPARSTKGWPRVNTQAEGLQARCYSGQKFRMQDSNNSPGQVPIAITRAPPR